MSYCRNNGDDSDVYVFATASEYIAGWYCCGCSLVNSTTDRFTETRQEMITHLEKHLANGDKVPDRAFERLRREIQEES